MRGLPHTHLIICFIAASWLCISQLCLPALAQPNSSNSATPPAAAAGTTGANSRNNPCCAKLQVLKFSSNLPVMIVELGDLTQVPGLAPAAAKLMAKGPDLPATLCTCGAPGGLDFPSVPSEIRVRGSTSARDYAKKSFALNTVDQIKNLSTASDENIRLLGLPADNGWVLHGPENDRTLGMRNWLAYWTARQMGRYASRTVYYEMFLNTDPGTPLSMQHYWGVYQLQEKVSRGKNRVDVQKLDPETATDLSGGYMMSYENNNIEPTNVVIQLKLTQLVIIIDYPNIDQNAVTGQRTLMWITDWMNTFEQDLLAKNVSQLGEELDVPAAVDYFLGTEVTKNPDGYRGSIKMHKDRDGPLVMGPMWDYNEAFGMCCGYPIEGYQASGASNGTSGGSAVSAAGWRFNICQDRGRCVVEPGDGVSQWYRKLWLDPVFRVSAAKRWAELRKPGGPLSDELYKQELSKVRQQLSQGAATRNFQRWSTALNNPAYGPPYNDGQAMLNDETRILQDWLMARLKWMDAAFAKQADPNAPADAYLSVGYIVPEPEQAGADNLPQGTSIPGLTAVASGKR